MRALLPLTKRDTGSVNGKSYLSNHMYNKKLVVTVHKGFPAVEVINNLSVAETLYVNKAEMSMLSFLQYVAKQEGLVIMGLVGQTAYCN